jgi:hypothetical protein
MRIQEPRNPTFRMNRACEGDLLPTRRSHSLDEKVDQRITDSRPIAHFFDLFLGGSVPLESERPLA